MDSDHITQLRPTYASNQRRNYACLTNGRELDIPSFGVAGRKGGRDEARGGSEIRVFQSSIRNNLHMAVPSAFLK